MTLTVSQAFEQFLQSISITNYHRETLFPARRRSVVDDLTDAFPDSSDMPFWKAYLIGSAAKRTILRPIDDIDILAVFSDENGAWRKYRQDSQAFLYRIRRAYDGYAVQQVGARGQAVRVFYNHHGHIDIAPVFSDGSGDFSLPAGDGSWLTTSPLKANAWFSNQNQSVDYKLSRLVRILKKWNAAHSSRLRSFHLETIAAATFSTMGNRRQVSMRNFFKWAPEHLNVRDPGGHSGNLSTYLTTASRRAVRDSLDLGLSRAQRALDAEDDGHHGEAKRIWQMILGEDFPTG